MLPNAPSNRPTIRTFSTGKKHCSIYKLTWIIAPAAQRARLLKNQNNVLVRYSINILHFSTQLYHIFFTYKLLIFNGIKMGSVEEIYENEIHRTITRRTSFKIQEVNDCLNSYYLYCRITILLLIKYTLYLFIFNICACLPDFNNVCRNFQVNQQDKFASTFYFGFCLLIGYYSRTS